MLSIFLPLGHLYIYVDTSINYLTNKVALTSHFQYGLYTTVLLTISVLIDSLSWGQEENFPLYK